MAIWKERLQNFKDTLNEKSAPARAQITSLVRKLAPRLQAFAERIRLREKLQKILPADLARSLPKSWDWRAILEWLGAAVQKRGAAFYGTLFAVVVSLFFIADLTALWIEGRLPELSPRDSSTLSASRLRRTTLREEDYGVIWQRNLFSSAGLLPGDNSPAGPGDATDKGGTPQPTTLPFGLVGTIILRDELKSIASIEDKSAQQVYPVRVEDEIPSKARILKIEPNRVTFVNLSTGRREYVDIPVDDASNRVTLSQPSAPKTANIARTGNTFNVPRNELDRAFTDLNSVLTQARAVPHFVNGVPAGYKLFQVVPDGFFGKLGLKDQDIINGIDGQAINDPAKAIEMLGQLKTANHVELSVTRDGRKQNFSYEIR